MEISALLWDFFALKNFMFIPCITSGLRKYPGPERRLTVTQADTVWSPQGTKRLHPYQWAAPQQWKKPTMPHKLKEGQNGISAKQLKNIMIAFIKLSVILTGMSSLTRKHCLVCTKTWATPVEKHAPTNELISDMSCGVYVRVVLQCTWLPFTALVRL